MESGFSPIPFFYLLIKRGGSLKSIRIFTPDLQLVAEIDDYEYFMYRRSYHSTGKFELRINSYKKHVDKLVKNNLVMFDNNPYKVGIIRHREVGLDEDGKESEQWVITGPTLKGLLHQRLIIPPATDSHDRVEGSVETVMKHFVNNHIVNPTNPKRKIPNFRIAEDLKRGEVIPYSCRYTGLGDAVEFLSKIHGMGWEVYLDLKAQEIVFDVYVGRDLTSRQSEYPPAIFSTEYETLESASFTESLTDFYNFVVVGGEGEGELREVAEVGDGIGIDRYEKFMDAVINSSLTLEEQGQNEIAALSETLSFDGKVASHNPALVFEKDWFVGDIVTIMHKGWNILMHSRATAVLETCDENGETVEINFGQGKTTIVSKIKSEIDQFSNGIRK